MQNPSVSGQTPLGGSNIYSASIPISLYREVTAELQESKAILDSLKAENQHLTQQNQLLRRELENVIQVATQLQQAINKAQTVSQVRSPQASSVTATRFSFEIPAPPSPPVEPPIINPTLQSFVPEADLPLPEPEHQPFISNTPEPLLSEQPENRFRPLSRSQQTELSGFWLIISILLIVVVAFGAGYWIVRPLIQQQR